jgi:hypothetical protein
VLLFTARFAPTFRSAPSFVASPPCSTVRRKCLPPSLPLFCSLASLYAGPRCRFDFVDGIFFFAYAFSASPRGCLPRGDPQGTLCRRDLLTNSLRLKGSSQDTLVSLCLAMPLRLLSLSKFQQFQFPTGDPVSVADYCDGCPPPSRLLDGEMQCKVSVASAVLLEETASSGVHRWQTLPPRTKSQQASKLALPRYRAPQSPSCPQSSVKAAFEDGGGGIVRLFACDTQRDPSRAIAITVRRKPSPPDTGAPKVYGRTDGKPLLAAIRHRFVSRCPASEARCLRRRQPRQLNASVHHVLRIERQSQAL